VDFEGWDHHENIGQNFTAQAQELGNALFAFTDDLGDIMNRVTIVTLTEFGRRVQENASYGTDHGAGAVMMALGAGVSGGKIYGRWPGLSDDELDGGDLRVTTDYRQVLAELLVQGQGQTAIGSVFPSIHYNPLGVAGQTAAAAPTPTVASQTPAAATPTYDPAAHFVPPPPGTFPAVPPI
jgi:uncharacterized protein (DUF1501 family)